MKWLIIILMAVMVIALAENISAVSVTDCINITTSGTYDLANDIGAQGKMDCGDNNIVIHLE